MRRLTLICAHLCLSVALLAAPVATTGCSRAQRVDSAGNPITASQSRLTDLNDSVALAYDTIADARDAGVIHQHDIDPYQPYFDAIDNALDSAGDASRKGDASQVEVYVGAARAALVKLQPLIAVSKQRNR